MSTPYGRAMSDQPAMPRPGAATMPRMGQGTWRLGDDPAARDREVAALREGIDRGLTLVDTAEMYGDGRSEELVGEAIRGRRDEVFLVSKMTPGPGREGTVRACEESLRRLGTDHLDLYLLHWSGGAPLEETVAGFTQLVDDGKIAAFGVSNLDLDEMEELTGIPGGERTVTDQLLYNLDQRGIEADLLPWLRGAGMPVMAYSPFDQGGLLRHAGLAAFARERGVTPGQVALAWLLSRDQVVPIPKSASASRVAENADALELTLSAEDHAELDAMFPPPPGPVPLQIY